MPQLEYRYDPSPMAKLGYAVARRIEPLLPDWVTPNQVTVIGCGGMAVAGLAFYLAGFNRSWFVAAELAVIVHWLADHLDGYLARARGLTSDRGLFLDMYLDMASVIFLLYGIGSAPYASFQIMTTYLIVVLMRGLVRDARLVRLRVTMPDISGSLARVAALIAEAGGNIVEVQHQRVFGTASVKSTEIEFLIETRERAHTEALVRALETNGLKTTLV